MSISYRFDNGVEENWLNATHVLGNTTLAEYVLMSNFIHGIIILLS